MHLGHQVQHLEYRNREHTFINIFVKQTTYLCGVVAEDIEDSDENENAKSRDEIFWSVNGNVYNDEDDDEQDSGDHKAPVNAEKKEETSSIVPAFLQVQ